MAKTKADLLEEAKALGLELDGKQTIAQIKEAIDGHNQETSQDSSAGQTEEKVAAAEAGADTDVTVAKAGKRSAKALAEAEAKQAKEERKAQTEAAEAEDKPKQPVTPTRSRLERRGKKFRQAAEQVDATKAYTLKEALELAVKTSPAKFDATVELHVNLNVDPRQADQNIRGNVILPEGTGKDFRVAAFTVDKIDGADLSGIETISKQLDKGEINFDVLVSAPANMAKLGKFARLLGPRGLMPNPKSGTVTPDLTKAVAEAKAGRVEYRVDSTGIVHLGLGKVSFGETKLAANIEAVFASLRASKPASVKGVFVKAIHLTTTMGPSITVAASEL
jgi:large subunit ribosomal protein L1